jgi:hypothetical protein
MHQGCVARANEGGGSGGVVADITKLSLSREAYYARELATDHEQYLSGHGESPGRARLRRGPAPDQERVDPYGLGDPATGRAVLAAHHAGVAEAVAYLDTHIGTRRGHGGHEHVSGQGC